MMKKLGLLLLLPACLQQGLVADPNALTNETNTTSSGGDTDPAPDPVAQISFTKKSGQSYKTVFGDKGISSSHPIQGYGSGEKGETFCFSKESNSESPCKKPLESENLSSEENNLLDDLNELDISSTNKLGLVIHALQFYFSNTPTAPTNNYYTKISDLRVSLKTAPILFDEKTGEFFWDTSKEMPMTYTSNSCSLTAPGSVGFDIISDSTLGTKSERAKYFVTGLWVFERSPAKPYESIQNNVHPIGPYSGTTDGPSQLFASRTNIFSTLLLPDYLSSSNEYAYQHFPGDVGGSSPFKYTIGLYNRDSFHSGINPLSNDDNSTFTDTSGAIITPVMGKYDQSGNDIDDKHSSSNNIGWEKRVVTGLCISGNRRTYNGSDTSTSTNPIWDYPVIHALRYELRKIKVVLK